MKEEIVFTLRLTEEDWEPGMSAWRCAAFDIPSSSIKEAFDPDGQRISPNMFKVEKGPARLNWLGASHPSRIVAILGIREALSPTSEEEWWKRFALVTPIITALIAAAATYYSRPSPSPIEHTLRLRVDPNDVDGSGLPPARILINNQELRQPIDYKVTSDVAAIVDVNKAYSAVRALSQAADSSVQSLNAIANQVNGFTFTVTGNVCSGGSSGIPPQSSAAFRQQGTDIQNKLRGVAADLAASQASIRK